MNNVNNINNVDKNILCLKYIFNINTISLLIYIIFTNSITRLSCFHKYQ